MRATSAKRAPTSATVEPSSTVTVTAAAIAPNTQTAIDGSYTFSNLLPGDYVVVQTNAAGYVDVADQDTTPDGDLTDGDTAVDSHLDLPRLDHDLEWCLGPGPGLETCRALARQHRADPHGATPDQQDGQQRRQQHGAQCRRRRRRRGRRPMQRQVR